MTRSKLPTGFRDQAQAISLLRGCNDRELAVVASHTTALTVDPGTVLCSEGRPGFEAFIIMSGDADVVVGGTPVARLTAGDVCGEMALLDHGLRTATVTAATPMGLLVMSLGDFNALLHAAPSFTRRLLEAVSARLREADENLHVT